MGHLTTRDAYRNLSDRINWFTQGAPTSETLYKILEVLYTEKEAKWVALLPVRPFTVKKAAKIWQTSEFKAERLLDHLCEKALLVDSYHNGIRKFVMPPPMAGFIEFALMRTRGDIDQHYLGELYYQYMNVEEDFIKDLFFATETKLGRVYVQEPVLTNDKTNHILDYERATHIVEEAEYIGLGLCYCRHKMFHAGHPCEINAPWDVCLTFDNVARSLAQHGDYARLISKAEALDALERSYASNLVQIGENVREHSSVTAAAAAVRRCRRQDISVRCSRWQRRIIYRKYPWRTVWAAVSVPRSVRFWPFPWKKERMERKRRL